MRWTPSARVLETDMGLTRPEFIRGVAECSTQRAYEAIGSLQDLRVF
jgi:hypothetical protein